MKDTKQAIDILVLLNIDRVSNLFSDVPVAKYICKPQLQEDVRLFDGKFVKMETF